LGPQNIFYLSDEIIFFVYAKLRQFIRATKMMSGRKSNNLNIILKYEQEQALLCG
jgi:hypothetical protein